LLERRNDLSLVVASSLDCYEEAQSVVVDEDLTGVKITQGT
jgi:hypothetical protein